MTELEKYFAKVASDQPFSKSYFINLLSERRADLKDYFTAEDIRQVIQILKKGHRTL